MLRSVNSGRLFWRGDCTVAQILMYGVVPDRSRHGIHVVRALDEILDLSEIDDIAENMRAHILAKRGEQMPNVVVIQGDANETLRLFGEAHAVRVVREALFDKAVSWSPLELGATSWV